MTAASNGRRQRSSQSFSARRWASLSAAAFAPSSPARGCGGGRGGDDFGCHSGSAGGGTKAKKDGEQQTCQKKGF